MNSIADWLAGLPNEQVKIGVTDIDGVLRTKYLHRSKVLKAVREGFGFCNVIFGWDSQDQLYASAEEKSGFPDARARLIPGSQRLIPWEDKLPFILADFQETGPDGPEDACPRSLLARIVQRAEDMGFTPRFGPEFEWFAYRETPHSLANKKYTNLEPLTPGMFGYSGLRTSENSAFYQALFQQLAAFKVNLEGLHTETGPGALEAALVHQPALEAADRALLFKQGSKEISYRHGLVASFMAKPRADLPGCGGHLHQSLWQAERNIFYDGGAPDKMSQTMRHYLAGQLTLLPALLPLFAPNVNSYKRYVAGSWAATRLNWGYDNRTVALRVIQDSQQGSRIETRLPGADANPYLSIAAALAAGLYGIAHELPLPLPAVKGNAYQQKIGSPLSPNLGEAITVMRNDPRIEEILGTAFTAHFLESRAWEWSRYQAAVTDWERQRYFELS